MSRFFINICILLTFTHVLLEVAGSRTSYQVGLVFYYPPQEANTPENITIDNANRLKNIIHQMSEEYKLDIIVLPEYSLTPIPKGRFDGPPRPQKYDPLGTSLLEGKYKPDKKSGYVKQLRDYFRLSASVLDKWKNRVLCEADHLLNVNQALEIISCAAKESKAYVVANAFVVEPCLKIPCNYHYHLYNSNIVFSRDGTLIAYYYKHINYDEPWIDVPEHPENVTFTTDFDVTFGLLIGDDFKFAGPTDAYIKSNVTDVILTTSQLEYVPFLRSVQDFDAWARKADINLLVSGYSWDGAGGIYMGKEGPMCRYESYITSKFAIVENVTIRERDGFKLLKNYAVYEFENKSEDRKIPFQPIPENSSIINASPEGYHDYVKIDPRARFIDRMLCAGDSCCYFNLTYTYNQTLIDKNTDAKQYTYRIMMVRNVYQSLTDRIIGIETCVLIACKDNNLDTCGKKISSKVIHPITFTSIMIQRRANTTYDIYSPITTSSTNVLYNKLDYVYVPGSPSTSGLVLIHLARPIDNLMIFGINGRRIDVDPELLKIVPIPWYAGFVSWWNRWQTAIGIVCGVAVCITSFVIAIVCFRDKITEEFAKKNTTPPTIQVWAPPPDNENNDANNDKNDDEDEIENPRDSIFFCCLTALKHVCDMLSCKYSCKNRGTGDENRALDGSIELEDLNRTTDTALDPPDSQVIDQQPGTSQGSSSAPGMDYLRVPGR